MVMLEAAVLSVGMYRASAPSTAEVVTDWMSLESEKVKTSVATPMASMQATNWSACSTELGSAEQYRTETFLASGTSSITQSA